ncbi:MAG: transcription-repair coupling factor, partial [Humibacillus sp.]|nr:transcription-repair coupling factor [Humibacillus sp.]
MSVTAVCESLRLDDRVRAVLGALDRPLVDITVAGGARAPLVATLTRHGDVHGQADDGTLAPDAARPIVVVTATTREADDFAAALGSFLPPETIATFPSWETLPHERLSPRSDTVGRRLAVLRRVAHPEPDGGAYGPLRVVVVPVRALLQPIAIGLADLVPVSLRVGQERPLEEVVDALVAAAYTRTDLVERRGEFAVRGGLLDVFPPTEQHPVRIEFWGDTVEEIRWFKVADQRSLEVSEHGLWAPPCRELLLTDSVRARARALASQLPGVADLLEKVAEGIAVEGMESLAPALVDGMESMLDTFPHGSMVLLSDPERIRTRAHDLVATSAEFLDASWSNAAAGNVVPIDLQSVLGTASYWDLADVRAHALEIGARWWSLTSFTADSDLARPTEPTGPDAVPGAGSALSFDLGTADVEAFRGNTEAAVSALSGWARDGWSVLVVVDGPGLARRVTEILGENEVPVTMAEADPGAPLAAGIVHVTTGALGHGFLLPAQRLVVVAESDLTGQPGGGTTTKDMRRMPSRRRNQVDPLSLRPGDHVVHEQHGVGRFVEMMQRTVQGATREYLVIEYAPSRRGQPG